jgi:Stress responsive A/B Barrel Domain
MFRHVVMLRWKAEATAEQRAAVRTRLSALPALIPELRSYVIGVDAHVSEGNYDMVIVADFNDVDGYLVYRDQPDHQAVIRECIQPILAERAAVQHEGVGES